MLRLIFVILMGMSLIPGLAYAQGASKPSNPYLAEMQQTLDKANTKATSDFNKQFPQPTPSVPETTSKGTSSTAQPKLPTHPQNQPPANINTQTEIAVTGEKKDEKKDNVVNIFGTPGASTSAQETNNQNANTTRNIFR